MNEVAMARYTTVPPIDGEYWFVSSTHFSGIQLVTAVCRERLAAVELKDGEYYLGPLPNPIRERLIAKGIINSDGDELPAKPQLVVESVP